MNVLMCSADFYVIFNDMKHRVYAIKSTKHSGSYTKVNIVELLLYVNDEWVWIYSKSCKPFQEEKSNK